MAVPAHSSSASAWLVAAATAAAGTPVSFTDVTEQAGLAVSHAYIGKGSTGKEMGSGGAVADFNNDGWQDIFILSGGHTPDHLFLNNRDGTFTDHAAAWGLHTLDQHIGSGAVAADINDDGLIDLFITSHGLAGTEGQPGRHLLLLAVQPQTEGEPPSFAEVAAACGVSTTSTLIPDGFGAALGDIDLDGDLDLAVSGWVPIGHNYLYRNTGTDPDNKPLFTDITSTIDSPYATASMGLSTAGFSPRIVDTDGDWRPEILWISDFVTSRYLRNNPDGTFTDITEQTGTGLDQNGMGVTLGDFNNDQLIDYYVTAIDQPGFIKPREGNRLYINEGNHAFSETALEAGVHAGHWGWGTTALDTDHDGDLDLAEVNGWNSIPLFRSQPALLFENRFRQTNTVAFDEIGAQAGFAHVSDGRGIARIDYDNDGDQDVIIFSHLERFTLLRNDLISGGTTPPDANWIRFFVDTKARPDLAPHGIGATVTIKTGLGIQHAAIDAGTTFLVSEERSAHFGIGDETTVSAIDVEFHDGTLMRLFDTPANQTLTLATPACRADLAAPFGVRDLADIQAFVGFFMQGHRAANLDDQGDPHDAPVLDLADIQAFVSQFTSCG